MANSMKAAIVRQFGGPLNIAGVSFPLPVPRRLSDQGHGDRCLSHTLIDGRWRISIASLPTSEPASGLPDRHQNLSRTRKTPGANRNLDLA